MKPIGPLMREHRTIEKIVPFLNLELQKINETGKINPFFIFTAVDFFRTYADRTHHGKEEDILFKALKIKKLPPELKRIMDELVSEHVVARKTVAALNNANESYIKGVPGAVKDILDCLKKLAGLYPKHIEKEDKHFFYPVLDYLDKQEQDEMLERFREFDRNMIHEKYTRVIEGLPSLLDNELR